MEWVIDTTQVIGDISDRWFFAHQCFLLVLISMPANANIPFQRLEKKIWIQEGFSYREHDVSVIKITNKRFQFHSLVILCRILSKWTCLHEIKCLFHLAQCHFDQRNAAAGKRCRAVNLVFTHAMRFVVVLQFVIFEWQYFGRWHTETTIVSSIH